MQNSRKIVLIVGPTAVGKTFYSLKIAEILDGEIVSADSMQIYKYMDIGSAKPKKEELSRIKHYLVDEVDPRVVWSVADYQKRAKIYIEEIFKHGKLPIVSGGTGLYVNSLIYDMDFSKAKQTDLRKELEEEAQIYGKHRIYEKLKKLDPEAAKRIHPNNLKRVIRAIEVYKTTGKGMPEFSESFKKTDDYECILIGLKRDRQILYNRINIRVDELINLGLVDEVKELLDMGLTEENISMKGIGYKEIIGYLNGEYSLEEAIKLIKRNTRRYAKRQMTWFNRYKDIKWFDLCSLESEGKGVESIVSYLKSELSN
ncbi:MAG: tRNA (adenosine(37)-N6)-dimethylallyltransferase MiaA [Clostridiales bacterium]|nr:tRNA (adenosine(37)-N6)-dimethylallyltransferase MiaA [Clostridiales bacterium]